MTLTMKEWNRYEQEFLAPYAQKSKNSKGRIYPESAHAFRTIYQRDCDRIVHSRAFRRLEYKTQVFVNHEGDHYRTRLTHTLEVGSIARTIARALKLNEDLTVAIALAHDLGHPPFGHTGEHALAELMSDQEGFEHNKQSLRVVEVLEKKYPTHPGLNLTWEVREGIMKHKSTYDKPDMSAFKKDTSSSLEAQVVDIADEIAYNCHDVDDGLSSGLLTEKELHSVPLWNACLNDIRKAHPRASDEVIRYFSVRALIDTQAKDVIFNTEKLIRSLRIKSANDVRNHHENIVVPSKNLLKDGTILKKFLLNKLYTHPRVQKMNKNATKVVTYLFETYRKNEELLPVQTKRKHSEETKKRFICDYIAGMTDRFALDEYRRLSKKR
ncbi:MAG: deoxyguanosinetriphosphate triphosphohydrolase [Candidatus Ancaeobacter aquaticus]|nr:deoxyguanosinetriphosphate triphosphohydrolase [Candidatus Ancaeobacter aquaticus]